MSGTRLAPALAALLLSAGGPPAAPGRAAPEAKAPPPAARPSDPAFTALEQGLELAAFDGPSPAPGDGKIWILRIDPRQFELRLVNASASDARPRTVRAWAVGAGAVAGINAGMFQSDGLTAVGLMRTRVHQNNPRRSTRFKAVLAFDPLSGELPPVRILDAACGELEPALGTYGSLVQSIRMVSCDRRNVWAADPKRWSTAAVGVDGAGRILFVHARSPWPVHDLVNALLALPVDLRRAMYVEGGPEAQLFVRAGGREVERLGLLEGTTEDRGGGLAWEIPNALVAVRRR
ncbi:MAG TPA: phosphodiester glycosidase family protein [Anaeromyxobacteraceae bacterium]|nr:phosphodiester glycosidase family protein [Anaeromyxobacteraceae bacterium]